MITDPAEFEKQRIAGAVRTDLILSAEIMAITLNELDLPTWWERGLALALVAFVVTVVVYGAVALIVKMDDVGMKMLRESEVTNVRRLGVMLLRGMPKLLAALSFIGTIAMLWVGGGIIVHGTHEVGFDLFYDIAHGAEYWVQGVTGALSDIAGWLTYAGVSAVLGLGLGAMIAVLLHRVFGYEGAH